MAYAAVVLLIQNLEEIFNAEPHFVKLKKEQIESLYEEVNFLLSFLNDSQERGFDHAVVKELETHIRNAVHKAADFIDSHMYISNMGHSYLPERNIGWNQISLIAHSNFTEIIEEIKSVKLKVLKTNENNVLKTNENNVSGRDILAAGNPLAQELPSSLLDEKLVGIDDDIETLLGRLIGLTSHLQVIPIVGMGGIGKTTLARRIYNDSYVVYHFYVRAWITLPQGLTVSLSYQVREILLGLLQCFTTITDEIRKMTKEELGEQIYKKLKGMRYLIVLDDMWHTKAWTILKMFFPDDKNGSRILLTSRLDMVAVHMSPKSSHHCMHFLGPAESWELLESKLFSKESCPLELVETGKSIAKRCQGLPLAIVIVAGLLNKMSKSLNNWRKVAESVDTFDAKDPEHFMDILALSYNYLPNSLKACFLYMGTFPRHHEIPVSRLLWLWIAEGFIQPVTGKCSEEVAEKCLEDLVSRYLILVGRRRPNGRIKTCHIHDLLHDLCLRESKKDNFLHVIKRPSSLMKPIDHRRISLHASVLHYYYSMSLIPLTRSFLCFDVNKILPDLFLLEFMDQMDFKLLRVLDIMLLRSNHFPIEIVDLVHLRYLALAVNCELPGSISKLQNLQTLIIDHIWEGQYVPVEIWKMPQLRHVHFKRGCYVPLPSCGRGIEVNNGLVLKNLQTLSTLIGHVSCSKEVFASLPCLRKLEIIGTEKNSEVEWYSECLSNLVCLKELEALKCSFLYRPRMHRLPQWDVFPGNLKELTLSGSYLPWEDMATLCMLPNLEVLKLRHYAFDGDSWKHVEEGFLKLKFFLMDNSDPMNWDAESSHFPSLERLVLKECRWLREIPEGVGDILTLQMIELHACNIVLVNSARKIHEQQQMLGNDELGIQITWGDNYPPSYRKLFS